MKAGRKKREEEGRGGNGTKQVVKRLETKKRTDELPGWKGGRGKVVDEEGWMRRKVVDGVSGRGDIDG